MQGAFAWLNELIGLFLDLIPRPQIIPSTHAGVRFVRGKPRIIKPGGKWQWYWPFWTKILTYPVVRQTLNLPSQVIMVRTGEGESRQAICVSAIVVYEVHNVEWALTRVHELDEAISDLGLAAVKKVLCPKNLNDIYNARPEIDREIKQDLMDKLRALGVTIKNVFISDLAVCVVIKVLTNSPALQYLPVNGLKLEGD